MKYLLSIKYPLLHEIRSYKYLFLLAASILLTISFIPSKDSAYSTISFGNYMAEYSGTWICYTTAIMSSLVMAILGGYIVSDSIQKDKSLRLSQILASTPTSNFNFLFQKVVMNFLLLCFILVISMLMTAILVVYHNSITELSLIEIIKPVLFISVPTALVISTIAIALEILIPKQKILRYIIFIVVFLFSAAPTQNKQWSHVRDFFGIKYSSEQLVESVKQTTNNELIGMSIGFSKNDTNAVKESFEFAGFSFNSDFIFSRLLLCLACFALILILSFRFNRFKSNNMKNRDASTTASLIENPSTLSNISLNAINFNTRELAPGKFDLVLAELYVMVKSIPSRLLVLSICLIVASMIVPIATSLTYVIPILVLFQIIVFSNIVTRDKEFRTNNIVLTSYLDNIKIIWNRQVAASILLIIVTLPFLLRLAVFNGMVVQALNCIVGLIFIVLFGGLLESITKSRKIFEIIMVFITYGCMNAMGIVDYLGASVNTIIPLIILGIFFFALTSILVSKRVANG